MDIRIGDEVYWNDPDEGFSSGYYRVHDIYSESKTAEDSDTILFLKNEAGSEAEVFAHEIKGAA